MKKCTENEMYNKTLFSEPKIIKKKTKLKSKIVQSHTHNHKRQMTEKHMTLTYLVLYLQHFLHVCFVGVFSFNRECIKTST